MIIAVKLQQTVARRKVAWTAPSAAQTISEFNFVGSQMKIIRAAPDGSTDYGG
jgi:hypothetical protein